jgi:DNA polymerase type B, organellar and viral
MPATSPDAIARKRARDNERRKEREATDPAYRKKRRKQRDRADDAFKKKNPEGHRRRSERKETRRKTDARAKRDERPFIGCDGEGVGRDPHRYALFRMGEFELGPFEGDRSLSSFELLDFITRYPEPERNHVLVAFAFDYDCSMILRDLKTERNGEHMSEMERLFALDQATRRGDGSYRKHWWTRVQFREQGATFGVQYIPRKYLKVCRMSWSDRERIYKTVPGTTRTIYDTFGFFQSSFVKALKAFNVGGDEVDAIERMKAKRENFDAITGEVRTYCKRECELLSDLMGVFRKLCLDCDIRPNKWNGAGQLAAFLHNKHGTLKTAEVDALISKPLDLMARHAYYGGRFEVSAFGLFEQPIIESDLKSAYPAAMLKLPCLVHGKWRKVSGVVLDTLLEENDNAALFVCPVTFSHPMERHVRPKWCGLPIRKDGTLSWPVLGKGTYWSVELRSAQKLGATIKCHEGFIFERRCDCQPFAWVEKYFNDRIDIVERLGKAAGIPIKLALNSLYGKLAQHKEPKFRNPIWCGLITAITRAKLNDAIAAVGPENVLMVATDGIYTTKKIPGIVVGDGLGQWECETFPSLFVVKPGIYWGCNDGLPLKDAKSKSRGVSASHLNPYRSEFMAACEQHLRRFTVPRHVDPFNPSHVTTPHVPVPVTTFISLRLGFRRNDIASACRWEHHELNISFDYTDKRDGFGLSRDRQSFQTIPKPGTHAFVSELSKGMVIADDDPRLTEPLLFEGLPDPLDLLPGDGRAW